MTTSVGIVNSALFKLGQNPIMTFDDSSKAARIAKVRYEPLRDVLLRAKKWSFALTRGQLAFDSETPAFGYQYRFPFPTDCLRIIQIGEVFTGMDLSDYRTMDSALYRIEGRAILANSAGPLNVRYQKRVEDPNEFDPTFVESLACYCAYDWAVPITDSAQKKTAAKEEFTMSLRLAVAANAIEVDADPLPDDTWVMARLG